MKRSTLLIFVLLLNFICSFAQEKISGIVIDEKGDGLPGVTVLVKGTKTGTTTDFDGKFSIEILDRNSFLIFSYIGMSPKEIFVGDQVDVKVKIADNHDLEEAVVYSEGHGDKVKTQDKKNYALVRVYFATDRNQTQSKEPSEIFGTKRSETVRYGMCNISIPRNHKKGFLEDASIFKLEYKNDPEKHITLLKVDIKEKDIFFSKITEGIRRSPDKKAFIFIHGYNVTFEDASRRTAQMAYDLKFKGAPVFYSWPSVGEVLGYNIDEGNNEWSETNLKIFLNDFLNKSDAEDIYLIAHSMGNRMLTRAMASIVAENPEKAKKIKEIILAAPDIDADVFKNVIAPALIKNNNPVTLYVSSNDWALYMSRKFSSYPRAGQTGDAMTILTGIDTIDATNVNCGFLGHSYIGDAPDVLSDISLIISSKFRANNRMGLTQVNRGDQIFWEFKR